MSKSLVMDKRILITGGKGFLGSWLVERLQMLEPRKISTPSRAQCDFSDREKVMTLFENERPELVIHAAASCGGIDFQRSYPAEVFRNDLLMSSNILEGCAKYGVEKVVLIGSSCAYPGDLDGDFLEQSLLTGDVHPSVASLGFAKRSLLYGARAYQKQFGLQFNYLILTGLYGPRDKFDLKTAHVVASLVRKFYEAKKNNSPEVVCWGTGIARRECLYIKDAVEGVVRALCMYNSDQPLNIGPGYGITIKELVETVRNITGFGGNVVWDTTKPDGALNKVLEVSKMKEVLQWQPTTVLADGLKQTIEWFSQNYQ